MLVELEKDIRIDDIINIKMKEEIIEGVNKKISKNQEQ